MEQSKLRVCANIAAIEILESYLVRQGISAFCDVVRDDAAGDKIMVGLEDNNRVFEAPVRLGNVLDYIGLLLRHSQNNKERIILGAGYLDIVRSEFVTGEASVRLTEKEVAILLHLYAQKGEMISRSDLLGAVWGYSQEMDTHTVETHIYRLRQKIESDPSSPEIIITDENGYRVDSSFF